jgi:hypothetical protein
METPSTVSKTGQTTCAYLQGWEEQMEIERARPVIEREHQYLPAVIFADRCYHQAVNSEELYVNDECYDVVTDDDWCESDDEEQAA